jgi:hypothetical protein
MAQAIAAVSAKTRTAARGAVRSSNAWNAGIRKNMNSGVTSEKYRGPKQEPAVQSPNAEIATQCSSRMAAR